MRSELSKFISNYKTKIDELYNSININELENILNVLIETFENGNSVYVCGNGGSAATASHMQADFGFFVRYFTDFRPKVFALTDNIPIITAVGNDTSYEDIIMEQLRGRVQIGDVLICISASGESKNLVKAVEYAKNHGVTTIGLIGFSGGALLEKCDFNIHTPSNKGEYGPVEDIHLILNHILVNYLCVNNRFLSIKSTN